MRAIGNLTKTGDREAGRGLRARHAALQRAT